MSDAAKPKTGVFTPELTEQIEDAGTVTEKAYANLRRIRHLETGGDGGIPATQSTMLADDALVDKSKEKDKALPAEVAIIQPIFRFFQLLCENHNLELQVHRVH